MNKPYYQWYRTTAPYKKTGQPLSAERVRQNALTAGQGWATSAKDFHWIEQNIPCQMACPAKTDIPGYLDAIARGDYREAYEINLRDNVFPAVLGRVCTRPCEPACRHGWEGLGEPVAICFSKRSAADFMDRQELITLEPMFEKTGLKITVVGSGAAGLAAARELALLGHEVTVLEKEQEPGGLMIHGIPEFRLPREWVRREIEQIQRTGVDIRCGQEISGPADLERLTGDCDALVLAVGTSRPYLPEIPGAALTGVHTGLTFLRSANLGETKAIEGNVVVIGGGFTAVDCARMAKRLGADSVQVFYRRTEAEMYISPHELAEMQEEGISFEPQVAPLAFLGREGHLTAVNLARTKPGERGTDGRRSFRIEEETTFVVDADHVLLATGQIRDEAWLADLLGGPLPPGRPHRTQHDKVFLAGDVETGAGSLIHAVAQGKACAHVVDQTLMSERRVGEAVWIEDADTTGRTREMDAIPRQPLPTLPVVERTATAEVETGYAEDAAQTEASRCYLCHFKFEIDNDLCIYCDRCLKVKPVEDCIVKAKALDYDDQGRMVDIVPSTSYEDYNLLYIDQSKCIRCNACRDVCPVECISLQKVSLKSVGYRG